MVFIDKCSYIGNDTRKKYYVTRKGHYLEDLY